MVLAELVDLEAFRSSLVPCSKSIFSIWRSTALDLEHERYADVTRTCNIWEEIPANELRVDQIISFIEELLRILRNPEKQKSLIRAEAYQFKTFT